MFTKNMAAAATKCCPLSDEQQFICMEDSVSTSVTSCLPVLEVLISNPCNQSHVGGHIHELSTEPNNCVLRRNPFSSAHAIVFD